MPWEKSFDESEFLETVMQIFWEKGYAATSISDITEATGIKRGSLYNAFDGKDDLFLQAILKYDNEKRQRLIQEIELIESPREAVSAFFDKLVKSSLADKDKKGCLLVNTSLEYEKHDDAVKKVIDDGFRKLATFFEKTVKAGQVAHEIPRSVDAKAAAKALVACLVGIRVLGRGTYGKTALQQIANQAMQLIS